MKTTTTCRPKKYTGKPVPPSIHSAAWRKEQYEEACENYAYWKRVAAATENPITRENALARVVLWKGTRDARKASL